MRVTRARVGKVIVGLLEEVDLCCGPPGWVPCRSSGEDVAKTYVGALRPASYAPCATRPLHVAPRPEATLPGRGTETDTEEVVVLGRSMVSGAILVTLGVAGCGSSGPSLSAFKSGFQADKAQFSAIGRDLQSSLQTAGKKTDAELGAEFSGLAARASQQAASLRKLNPPSKYKNLRDQLASDFDVVTADLSTIASAANSHDSTTARAATIKLIRDSATLKSVDDSLTTSLGLPQTG